ncbi:hypothetical protein SUGI_0857830 [Cryptomeria japonica]|nr:hypothetical protein SUGI_0857830 [Cryptomeria japonica]
MQQIREKWFNSSESICNVVSNGVESNRLSLKVFMDIFVLTGCVSLVTLIYYLRHLLYRFVQKNENSSHIKSISTRLQTFANYADKKEIPPPKRKRYETAMFSSVATASTSPEIFVLIS